ncbi:MAG TPA: hypothetical protein VL944_01965 [Candidatus Acidoferrum sp.]|nr:hypothetical protein [Candidatus Acidoferrum sp.]
MDCVICEAPARFKQDALFETPYWSAGLRSDEQSCLGRGVVRLNRHAGKISELTAAEWKDLRTTMRKYEDTVTRAFLPASFNWECLMNEAYTLSPPNPHVHWHVKPRYAHKVKIGDVVFEDKEFGKRATGSFQPPRSVIDEIIKMLRVQMESVRV